MDIRPFDHTLRDAQGIIDVDRETFGDCHYAPEYLLELAASARQHVWVAQADDRIVGFVSAFITHSLAAERWEVDLLAVHPSVQGRGIGTALVAQAMAAAPVPRIRCIIARSNIASQRAFLKNGFAPLADACLLVCRPRAAAKGGAIQGLGAGRGSFHVRRAMGRDVEALAALAGHPAQRVSSLCHGPDTIYWVVEQNQTVAGYAELVRVYTLQYEGLWLESIGESTDDPSATAALLCTIVDEARQDGKIDLIGYLAPPICAMPGQSGLDGDSYRHFDRVGDYVIFGKTLFIS